MNYLLDTCVISQFTRGNPCVVARIKGTPPRRIHVSTITCMELEYGLRLNPRRAIELRPVLDGLLNAASILAYDREDALATATIRARCGLFSWADSTPRNSSISRSNSG